MKNSKTTTVRISPEIDEQWEKIALQEGMSKNSIFNRAIRAFIKSKQKDKSFNEYRRQR